MALTIAAFGVAASGHHAAAAQPPADYRLVWSDEFKSLNLGDRPGAWFPHWRTWNVRHLTGNNDKAAKYADDEMLEGGITAGAMLEREGRWGDSPYLHEVSGGTLKLRAYPLSSAGRAKTSGFPFIASMISGERQPVQNHGYWETRLRFNRMGDGLHLAVWLLNDKHEWPPEIDILEVVGLHPAKFTANSHRKGGDAPYISSYQAPNGANGWHVFGFEWTEERMRWTVDGQVVREHENFYGDDRLYFLVSWEVGGNWAGMPTGNTPWPGEVEIDYVRLYEKAPTGQAATTSPAPTQPTPNQPTPTQAAPKPVSAEEAPPPPPDALPKPDAQPKPDGSPEPVTTPEPTTQAQPATEPVQTAEPEKATKTATTAEAKTTATPPPANPPATPPEQAAEPETTVEPAPTAKPQPSLAWRMARLRAFGFTTVPSQQPSQLPSLRLSQQPSPQLGAQPSPVAAPASPPQQSVQPMPRGVATWRAMRDRASLFRFAE